MRSMLLKADIDEYVAGLRTQSPLLAQARTGRVTPQAVSTYLNSVLYLLQYTEVCLRRSSSRARSLGLHALAEHFERKLVEEIGHERWAEADIRCLEGDFEVRPGDAVPAVVELVEFLLRAIDERPERYLAYILFAEYITVQLGPEWIEVLERNCGIPREALTVVERHAELDREHAADGLRDIDHLIRDPALFGELRATLASAMAYFSRFDREVSSLSN